MEFGLNSSQRRHTTHTCHRHQSDQRWNRCAFNKLLYVLATKAHGRVVTYEELTGESSGASVADGEGLTAVEWNGEYAVSLQVDGDDASLTDHAGHSDQSTASLASQRQLYTNTRRRREVITFRASRRRREMYCGHARCVSVCVCLSVRGRMPTLLHGPGCNLEEWWGWPLVAHYWADLQSVHLLWQHNANVKC